MSVDYKVRFIPKITAAAKVEEAMLAEQGFGRNRSESEKSACDEPAKKEHLLGSRTSLFAGLWQRLSALLAMAIAGNLAVFSRLLRFIIPLLYSTSKSTWQAERSLKNYSTRILRERK